MKKLLFITMIIINLPFIYAQNNLQFIYPSIAGVQTFTKGDVISDFGRRTGGTISSWHKGNDLCPIAPAGTLLIGSRLLSPVDGTITQLVVGGTYNYLVVADNNSTNNYDFGYGHIFHSGSPHTMNNMVLMKMDNVTNYAIIDLNASPIIAYSDLDGGNVTYRNSSGITTTYITTNQVKKNDAIAILGDAGTIDDEGNYHPHLHLYRPADPTDDPQLINNAKDPMQILNFTNTPFSVTIENLNNLTTKGQTTYFGGNVISALLVKAEMTNAGTQYGNDSRYSNSVMNVDNIILEIKKSSDPINAYSPLEGSSYFSLISHGARTGYLNGQLVSSVRYPATNNPIGTPASEDISERVAIYPAVKGSPSTASPVNGIIPTAHGSQADAYDQYVFSKIYTRIHKNDAFGTSAPDLALINNDARYPDGNYDLYAKVITVKGTRYPATAPNTPQKVIVIDNFKPYIRKVTIDYPIGKPLYTGEWKLDGTNIKFNEILSSSIGDDFYVYVTVWTSETVKNFVASSSEVPLKSLGNQTSGEKWVYTINPSDIKGKTQLTLNFTGVDLNGNNIIDLPNTQASTVPTANLFRNSSGIFTSTYNSGESFVITNLCASSLKSTEVSCTDPIGNDNEPTAKFTYTIGGTDNNVVTFTNTSVNGDYYYWDFGDGEVSYDQNPTAHYYPVLSYSASYYVTLSVTNLDGVTNEIAKKVTITGSEESEGITITGSNTGIEPNPELHYRFSYTIFGGQASYSYQYFMDYGDGDYDLTPSAGAFEHTYPETYTTETYYPRLTVSVYEGDNFIGDYSYTYNSISILSLQNMDIEVEFSLKSNASNNSILPESTFYLTANTFNGQGTHRFEWIMFTEPNKLDGTGTSKPIIQYSADGSNMLIDKFPDQEGEYLIKLNVYDQYGNQGYGEFVANVRYQSGCAEMRMVVESCASQYVVPKNKPIRFAVDYDVLPCKGDDYYNTRDIFTNYAGKIEWFVDEVSVGCSCISGPEVSQPSKFKCIAFNSSGPHKVRVVVTPFDYYIYGGISYPRMRNDLSSTLIKTVNVTECLSNKINLPNSGIDLTKPLTASNITVCQTPNSILKVSSGESIELNAYNINIYPGFSAVPGSKFHAKAIECEEISCESCTVDDDCDCNFAQYELPASAIQYNLDETWNDFCRGGFKAKFSVRDEFGGPYFAQSMTVKCNDYADCDNTKSHPLCGTDCSLQWWHSVLDDQEVSGEFGWACTQKKVYIKVNIFNNEYSSSDFKIGGFREKSAVDSSITNFENKDLIDDFVLYPNPTESQFTLELFGDVSAMSAIEIYNQLGQVIYRIDENIKQKNDILSNDWYSGIYNVKVTYINGKVVTKKIVKQ